MLNHITERIEERIGITMYTGNPHRFEAERIAKSEAVDLLCSKYKLNRQQAETRVNDIFKSLPKIEELTVSKP